MRRRFRLGLRARLVLALVGVALLAADIATIYSNINLNSHVAAAAHERLERSAIHYGDIAGVVHDGRHGWTPEAVALLRHLAEIDDLAVRLADGTGEAVLTIPATAPVEADATASVTAAGRDIGTVTVSQIDGELLTAEEVQLRHELNRMHLLAGVVSAAIALIVALYLALTLSRPLRQIRAGAQAMEAGRLDTRVQETGDEEVRSVARALNQFAETLEHHEELRKASVVDLAHELRTPVMGLLGRIEAAQDGVFDDEKGNLAAMHDEAMRLTHLLDDLSALAEAERPGLMLTVERVDLAEVVERQVGIVADQFAEKGLALEYDLQRGDVSGDPKRLEQIVVNLLSNAYRYTDRGGTVAVSVRQEGSDVVLEVADTGVGIPHDDLSRVFLRFWRGEKSRSRETGGTGIGLSIVKELVGAHAGTVTVESEVGKGSVFTVTIPAVQAKAASPRR